MSVLGEQHGNKFIVCDELKMENDERDEIKINHSAEDTIMEMRLYAVSTISMKNNQMGGHWKLVNFLQ